MPAPTPCTIPRFRRHLRVETADDTVYVFDEQGVTTLGGAPVVALAPLLDGHHDLGAVLHARPGGLGRDEVAGLLDRLEGAGLVRVETATPRAPEAALAWWDACGVGAGSLPPPGRVALTALGSGGGTAEDPEPIRAALIAAGVDVLDVTTVPDGAAPPPPDPRADVGVVLCADYLDPRLGELDREHRAAGTPWFPVNVAGRCAWLGPVFGSPGTGCWHCLETRLWAHRRAEAAVQRELGRSGPAERAATTLPPAAGALAHLVALEVTKWLGGLRYDGQRCVWTFDTAELDGRRHELRPRPQCPACGDPGLVAEAIARPVRLRPAPRAHGEPHRTAAASETFDAHRHLISPVTGVVKQVAADPHVPGFANAWRSGPNLARCDPGLPALRRGMRSESGGKGLTELDARVGALCEALERHCGTWQGDEPRLRGSLRSLGDAALDPRACLLVDEAQYAGRATWNGAHSAYNHVPEPFDPDAVIDWTPLWSLSNGARRLLPSAMLYHRAPPEPALRADSNGCAAGSSREDAILQGTLELIERDAVAQWWYCRLEVPPVDLDALGDPRLIQRRADHAGVGRELWVLDVTSDLGVPTAVAVSRRVDGGPENVLLGCGAHLDPARAVARAVTELDQMLHTDHAVPAAGDDPDAEAWAGQVVADHPHLRPSPHAPARRWVAVSQTGGDVRDDVEGLVALLRRHGMDTLVLDQTRPDVGLPVVRVVVPGLRPFWARFAPGRLVDAPLRDGRLAAPLRSDQLNPFPLFL